jgi:starch phosphorylase
VGRVDDIDDGELWETHQYLKMRLIRFVRRRLRIQSERLGQKDLLRQIDHILDPDVLTIGCARRFATYKRGDLIISQLDRMTKLINDTRRPIQIIFAGKAHPRDDDGKRLLQRIAQLSYSRQHRSSIVFVENTNTTWRVTRPGRGSLLTPPVAPRGVQGTCGQKGSSRRASTFPSWMMVERGIDGRNGFAIGHGACTNLSVQNQRDATSLRKPGEGSDHDVLPARHSGSHRVVRA